MNNDSTSRVASAVESRLRDLPAGTQLPSNRQLVSEFGVSALTVQKAMNLLSRQGLVEARPGVGTFTRPAIQMADGDFSWQTAALRPPRPEATRVSDAMREGRPGAIALQSGYPDRELLPERLVRSALAKAARTDAATSRAPAAGRPDLRQWFANQLGAAGPRAVSPPTARDVIILPGTQDGLSSIFRTVVGEGNVLIVESPTYWGAITAAIHARVHIVPVPSGPRGPDPQAVARAFEETGARAMYAQPSFANPTGAIWSPDTADAVLQAVRQHGAFLIEDDWAHDFGIDADSQPLAARDDSGHIVYLRSLTKSVSPAIRVGAVVARGPVFDRLIAERGAESMYVSTILQAAALEVVTNPGWKSHLRFLRQQLKLRRDALLQSLAIHLPTAEVEIRPLGGLNLWLRLPQDIDVASLVRASESDGLIIANGDDWYPAEPPSPHIRLNFSGPDPQRFDEGAQLLARAMERVS